MMDIEMLIFRSLVVTTGFSFVIARLLLLRDDYGMPSSIFWFFYCYQRLV